jgi:hypothetical protein
MCDASLFHPVHRVRRSEGMDINGAHGKGSFPHINKNLFELHGFLQDALKSLTIVPIIISHFLMCKNIFFDL